LTIVSPAAKGKRSKVCETVPQESLISRITIALISAIIAIFLPFGIFGGRLSFLDGSVMLSGSLIFLLLYLSDKIVLLLGFSLFFALPFVWRFGARRLALIYALWIALGWIEFYYVLRFIFKT
jgi:hypothetical protein